MHNLVISPGYCTFNDFHAAGEYRRQVKNNNKCCTKLKQIGIYYHICIQISTNMPGIDSVTREIAVKISEMLESKHDFAQ